VNGSDLALEHYRDIRLSAAGSGLLSPPTRHQRSAIDSHGTPRLCVRSEGQRASNEITCAATLSAQRPAGQESAEEPHKEVPPGTSLISPRHGRRQVTTQRGNCGNAKQQSNLLSSSEPPHCTTSGPSSM
jgi:hypothetical protein